MEEQKKVSKTEVVKSVLLCATVGLTAIVSYAIGRKAEKTLIGNGIQACWDADPTLEAHMWDALNKAKAKL